jgi:hypothetical protein
MKKLVMDDSYVFCDQMALMYDAECREQVTQKCALIAFLRIPYLIFISRPFLRCYVVFLLDIRCSD